MALELAWYDWVGLLGTMIILAGFFLLQAGRLAGTGLIYQLINLFGAAGILVSLLGKFNLSVFLLEAAWMVVSLYGIARSYKLKQATRGL
ncbi:CBU_0592 family membrane protein [Thermomonas sp.]